ncbi:Epidermis-specific secreted glycoprotein EP1 [Acorus calamus]|uniref:Epidermis-specific secreted glycoprotein EP1 n=1 Tax=Acorus calamus TaxID=4465 RepID=A0AAV9DM87_ACOCL|nr:Epidermis-specific secreted glycoprotein EP1 [Acorus calamus]
MTLSHPLFLLLIISLCFFTIAHAAVPVKNRLKYVNQGDFGEYSVEYGANYRLLGIGGTIFQLCFYNATPSAYVLAVRMGNRHTESQMLFVWEANRARPVGENATLELRADGNLVLSEADGTLAWQTATSNKGVVGLDLGPNGNLILYGSKRRIIWQSFDSPTDSFLNGQVFRPGGATQLVSRASETDGSDGPYSLKLESKGFTMYYKVPNSPNPIIYYYSSEMFEVEKGTTDNITFEAEQETEGASAYEIRFAFGGAVTATTGTRILSRPKYNATYTFLRMEMDGNLKAYTYDENVDWGAWEETFTLFDREGSSSARVSECYLPKHCGSLGMCESDMCVACPTPKGVLGWSSGCAPPKLPSCKSASVNVDYYKVVGAEHFSSRYNEGLGPMMLAECKKRCSTNCGCVGFFYREESSNCLTVPVLGTISSVSNTSHLAFIKIGK